MKNLKYYILFLVVTSILTSCTDPYVLRTTNYEEAIVVEATITNELKHQEIRLTKTYRLEDTAPTVVSDAVVTVYDNFGNDYPFAELNGVYVSVNEFQAQPNVEYHLKIITDDGKTYTSSNETLTHINPIQDVVPTVVTKEGVKGVEMVVNSFDPTNSSKYYRFEYEETNKIVAPKWVPVKGIGIFSTDSNGGLTGSINLVPRTTEARVCFNTKKSDKIIITSTNDLSEDRVIFPVRFIKSTDYTIANRYSILVKQYVQNLASYTYYKTLKELSGSDNILSQNQPGFFAGNIKRVEDPNEKVIGFFEVSSVSSKRIFFNYNQVFPNDITPKYPYKCEIDPLHPSDDPDHFFKLCFGLSLDCRGSQLISGLQNNQLCYYDNVNDVYEVYDIKCGDCTSFSSNIVPSFWID